MIHETHTRAVQTEQDLLAAVSTSAPAYSISASDLPGAATTVGRIDLSV